MASTNARAEAIMGRRLRPEDEKTGVVAIDFPCELGYKCPRCPEGIDLVWSEYACFLWCAKCDFDYPSALCLPMDTDEQRDHAVKVYLDTVEKALNRAPVAQEERGDG